ncbi:alpha/beta fold hydrolase [Nocardioides sp. Arc9.136]|uniref:alpha/beta fold hydrolase n=1 Tax=Nocardioides sp. Arc9.136 TaxID=2996826 RepID=UPI0026650993|nr:alpha/beta fold hydrolase [Nocardioides sp. Arc9.136]WKN48473.1 alpha/beta fold hydrolase [Nocardioides sp. Arc9.136]
MTTYVLVHGANYGGDSWRFVTPHLDGPCVVVDLPGRGRRPARLAEVTFEDFVSAAAEDVRAADVTDAVLVAHSAGGLTAAHLLNRVPERFRACVLVASTIPPHGEAIADNIDPGIREAVLAGSGDGTYVLDEETARAALCHDLDDERTRLALADMQADTTALLSEPSDLTGLQRLGAVTYVRTTLDRTLPVEHQDRAIAAIGDCRVVDLEAGHLAMYSRPEDLAALVVTAGR